MKFGFTSIAFTLFISISCNGQVFEWVKTYKNNNSAVTSIGRYFGDSTISFFLSSTASSIINIDNRGNTLKSSNPIPYSSYYQYDWMYMQQGLPNTVFSRASKTLYNKDLDSLKTFPTNDYCTFMAYGKDGSQLISNIFGASGNYSFFQCATSYFIRRFDKNSTNSYNLTFVSKQKSCCGVGIYTYDDYGNFYFGTQINNTSGKDTLIIGGQTYPITSLGQGSFGYVFSIDSIGNLRYLVSNGSTYIHPAYGKMKVGKDKKLYLLNGKGLLLQKYNINGAIMWNKTCQQSSNSLSGGLDLDDSCNVYVSTDLFIYKIDSSGREIFKKPIKGSTLSLLTIPENKEIYVTGMSGSNYSFDCFTSSGESFVAKLYTGTIPSFASISLSGINLNSNITQGNYWYRNDTLLANETKSNILLLRDGRYSLKAYCKQDSIKFDGISTNTLTGLLITFSIPGANYQWFLNGGTILGATQFSYLPTANGTYTVVINFDPSAVPNGRTEGSNNTKTAIYKTQVTNIVTDNHIFDVPSFKLYPNPNNGEFTVNLINNSSTSLEVMDMTGRVVHAQGLKDSNTNLQLQHLGKGVYSLRIGNQVKSIVIL